MIWCVNSVMCCELVVIGEGKRCTSIVYDMISVFCVLCSVFCTAYHYRVVSRGEGLRAERLLMY